MSTPFDIDFSSFGSDVHRRDVASLVHRGIPLPHGYTESAFSHSMGKRQWLRIRDENGQLVSGFVIQTSMSRALPGSYIGRVDRVGRRLHEPLIPYIGSLLARSARMIPRLQRLDIRIFDEDRARRIDIGDSIRRAGGAGVDQSSLYTRTIIMDLHDGAERSWPSMTSAARYKLRKFSRMQKVEVRPVNDPRYASRMQELLRDTFRRSGGKAPMVDMERLIQCAAEASTEKLLGVFLRDRPCPSDLVAFMLGWFHGDHGSYEAGASDRSDELRNVPLGYPLMAELVNWAHGLGGTWFDLGGIPSEGSPSTGLQRGIVDFKRQFSQREIDVAMEMRIVPHPILEKVARTLRTVTNVRQR